MSAWVACFLVLCQVISSLAGLVRIINTVDVRVEATIAGIPFSQLRPGAASTFRTVPEGDNLLKVDYINHGIVETEQKQYVIPPTATMIAVTGVNPLHCHVFSEEQASLSIGATRVQFLNLGDDVSTVTFQDVNSHYFYSSSLPYAKKTEYIPIPTLSTTFAAISTEGRQLTQKPVQLEKSTSYTLYYYRGTIQLIQDYPLVTPETGVVDHSFIQQHTTSQLFSVATPTTQAPSSTPSAPPPTPEGPPVKGMRVLLRNLVPTETNAHIKCQWIDMDYTLMEATIKYNGVVVFDIPMFHQGAHHGKPNNCKISPVGDDKHEWEWITPPVHEQTDNGPQWVVVIAPIDYTAKDPPTTATIFTKDYVGIHAYEFEKPAKGESHLRVAQLVPSPDFIEPGYQVMAYVVSQKNAQAPVVPYNFPPPAAPSNAPSAPEPTPSSVQPPAPSTNLPAPPQGVFQYWAGGRSLLQTASDEGWTTKEIQTNIDQTAELTSVGAAQTTPFWTGPFPRVGFANGAKPYILENGEYRVKYWKGKGTEFSQWEPLKLKDSAIEPLVTLGEGDAQLVEISGLSNQTGTYAIEVNSQEDDPQTVQEEDKDFWKKPAPWIVLGIVIVVLIGVAVFFIKRQREKMLADEHRPILG